MRVLVLGLLLFVASCGVAAGHEGNDDHFDTGELARGFSATHTFQKAGAVPFHCTYHPDTMRGSFRVSDDAVTNASILLELVDARIHFGDEEHTDLRIDLPVGATVEVVNRDPFDHRLVQEVPEDTPAPTVVAPLAALAVALLLLRR